MDLLIWTDAHMQSRAKIHRVAMLTKNFVKFHVPNVLLRCSSYLSDTFWRSLTPEDNIFGMSSSPFDCNRSPDSWRSMLRSLWHPVQTFQIWRFWFCDSWIPGGTLEVLSVARCLAWIYRLLTSQCVSSWAVLNGELLSCGTAASTWTLLFFGFDFDDAPMNIWT